MKKLIFCFDGTSNDPDDSNSYFSNTSITNILKLHLFLGGKLEPLNSNNPKTPHQHSFYYRGVGTRGCWITQLINSIFAPIHKDIKSILKQAHNDLKQHYKDGDSIYIFGFSRGAAIARMFAAQCQKEITFLGVFDTVAAVKGSFDFNAKTYPQSSIVFEKGTIGKHIKKAVHLLALDEKRIIFQPTLFNQDERVLEIWFSGVHADIGGGYWFDGLSDITLQFMLNCVAKDLQILNKEDLNPKNSSNSYIEKSIHWDDLNIKPLALGVLHEQKYSFMKSKILAPRLIRVNTNDLPDPSVAPIIHHSVCERFSKVTSYRPYALRGAQFRVMDQNGKLSPVYEGVSMLLNFYDQHKNLT